jgi:hypothetical protein
MTEATQQATHGSRISQMRMTEVARMTEWQSLEGAIQAMKEQSA